MAVQVIGDRVLVRRAEVSNVTEGGIILSENDTKRRLFEQVVGGKFVHGEVISTGEKVRYVGVGKVVLYDDRTATRMEVEGEVLDIVHEGNIAGIVKR